MTSSLPDRLLHTLNEWPRLLLVLVCSIMALPAAITGLAAWRGHLGTNPLEVLIREPGKWALIFLLLAMALAPIRHCLVAFARWRAWNFGKRLPDWNWLIRLRRPVGLASFSYATAHLCIYLSLDLGFSWTDFVDDLRNKPFIALGLVTFTLLFPLAVTSTKGWIRRLKLNWKRLHLLIFPAAILAEVHFILLSKPGVSDPVPYGLMLGCLLGFRALQLWKQGATRQDRVDGTSPERTVKLAPHPAKDASLS